MIRARHTLATLFAAAAIGCAAAAPAQNEPVLSPEAVERIRTEKKAWVALNMNLASAEETQFWPLYESYQKELQQINLRLVKLVESYGGAYRGNTLTDDLARKLAEETFAIDEAELKLRRSYYGRLAKAVSPLKAARYLQLESRVSTQIRHELAATLPLAGDVKPDITRTTR